MLREAAAAVEQGELRLAASFARQSMGSPRATV